MLSVWWDSTISYTHIHTHTHTHTRTITADCLWCMYVNDSIGLHRSRGVVEIRLKSDTSDKDKLEVAYRKQSPSLFTFVVVIWVKLEKVVK